MLQSNNTYAEEAVNNVQYDSDRLAVFDNFWENIDTFSSVSTFILG